MNKTYEIIVVNDASKDKTYHYNILKWFIFYTKYNKKKKNRGYLKAIYALREEDKYKNSIL